MTSRKEQNQDEIIGLIEQWHNSGKNKAEFCKEKNIGRSIFYHWLKIYDNHPVKKVTSVELIYNWCNTSVASLKSCILTPLASLCFGKLNVGCTCRLLPLTVLLSAI